jgi:hypothetical protein
MTIEIIQEITRSIIQLLVIPTVLYIVMEIVKTYFKRKNIKEEKYINLLDSLVSLYEGNQQEEGNKDKKQKFLKEFRHCWLYAPDKVVKNGQAFLNAIAENKPNMSKKEIDDYLQSKCLEFLLSIRKDMIMTTKIKEFGTYGIASKEENGI